MIKKQKISDFKNLDIDVLWNDLISKLFENFSGNKKLLIAVSGGPDSMFLSTIIYKIVIKNKLDLENLYFVHCNHKTRKECDLEQSFLEWFFDWCNFFVSKYSWQKKDENSLRSWRYWEFQKLIKKYSIDIILTWHNLTDRIETTFLNMFRGCDLNGFVSMKTFDTNSLLKNIQIIRPLLSLTKMQIEDCCKKNNIPYFVDHTNFDVDVSLRNKIRNEIFLKFGELSNKSWEKTNTFFDSMQNIYNSLEFDSKSTDLKLLEIKKSLYRNCDFAFLRDFPVSFVNQELFMDLLKKFDLYWNITKKTILEFVDFFRSSKQWFKYLNWVYFFVSHAKIYLIKAKQNFWKKNIEKSMIIDKLWLFELWKEKVELKDKNYIWCKLRYPKKWDKIWSKSWTKFCLNKKIPVFWRNFIPVLIKDGVIIDYFYKW